MPHKADTCVLAHDAAVDLIANYASDLRRHAKAAATHDVEGLHDMRVASRRLRAVLAAHARLFKKKRRKVFQATVREVTRGLGKARELDVTIAALAKRRNRLQGAPREAANDVLLYLRELRKNESAQVDSAVAIVSDPSFSEILDAMLARPKPAHSCYISDAAATLTAGFGALLRRFSAWQLEPNEESLHQVRIAFKKLRYHCEILGKLYGARMTRFIGQLKAAQEVLGDWNDIRVLRDYVADSPQASSDEFHTGVAELRAMFDEEAQGLLRAFSSSVVDLFSEAGYEHAIELFASARKPCCTPALYQTMQD